MKTAQRCRRGLSLVELLVVCATITVLVGLSIIGLRASRVAARGGDTLGKLRSHAQIVSMYAVDYAGVFPCVTDPGQLETVFTTPGGTLISPYFDVRFTWHIGMADQYYDGLHYAPAFYAKGAASTAMDPFWYSVSCVASAAYWNSSTRQPEGQFGGVRVDLTTFPSRKGIFLNSRGTEDQTWAFRDSNARLELACVDGHAETARQGDLSIPVSSGEGPAAWPRTRVRIGIPVIHTVDGVLGWDTRK
jgi:hypothetical protein